MENSNSLGGARIALLIDFDNVILGIDEPGFDIELVVNALRERGTITVSRVYGDWYRHSRHRRRLMEHGVELVEAPAFGPVIKNSADIKIALDGYEIGMTMPHINTFCLVSGDSDFLPLIKKLQGLGKNVLVICGNRFTSDMLRRNCNEFISYENLLAASYGADEDATTLEGAFALLHRAMEALRERGSEIRTSTLKQMMIQLNPVFSEKTFGYNQFRGFLDKAGRENLIKLGPRDRVSGEFYVLLPEEDEADVIEQIERAEAAEVVEEIAEARGRGGRNRRGDNRKDDNRRDDNRKGRDDKPSAPDEKEKVAVEAKAAVEAETTSRPRSRREARLMAHREQEEATSQNSESLPIPEAAPLATPLTPATDFSPADAQETQQMSISRGELLARGMRVGKLKFSGAKGIEKIETPAATPVEAPPEMPDIALALEDVQAEDVNAEDETIEVTPEINAEAAPVATKKPRRSRRRKKTADATETVEAEAALEVESTPTESAPAAENAPTQSESVVEDVTSTEIKRAPETEVAPAAKPRRRSRSKAKVEEAPASTDESPVEATPASVEASAPEKPRRTRRRKKTENTEETTDMTDDNTEKAVEADGTQHTVSTEALIAASAGTPAAQAEEQTKAKRRRTSRKTAEAAADAKAEVNENIVTTDATTGEVSQKELAQIPVPISEDEL